MPEVEERSHFKKPDFRIRNKIFAGLSRDEKRANVKLAVEFQSVVLDATPTVFSPAEGAWGRSGWTYVELEQVEIDELEGLIVHAWRLIAPKELSNSKARREGR